MKFRKKPIEVEAIQWDEKYETFEKLREWGAPVTWSGPDLVNNKDLIINTLEDGPSQQVKHYVTNGDYIVRGIQGEFYPCKPDIFEKTYDAI